MNISQLMQIIAARVIGANMKKIQVAAGVIFNTDRQVFLAKRADKADQGGLWEFPGGKLEPSETSIEALIRELDEELGIEVLSAQPLMQVSFDYPTKAVQLDVFSVFEFKGEPWGKEGQKTAWFELSELAELSFPEANKAILEKIMAEFG